MFSGNKISFRKIWTKTKKKKTLAADYEMINANKTGIACAFSQHTTHNENREPNDQTNARPVKTIHTIKRGLVTKSNKNIPSQTYWIKDRDSVRLGGRSIESRRFLSCFFFFFEFKIWWRCHNKYVRQQLTASIYSHSIFNSMAKLFLDFIRLFLLLLFLTLFWNA